MFFGESFIHWIKTLHQKLLSPQTGSHHTASHSTGAPDKDAHYLHFLFANIIEPLAAAIRQNNIIKRVDTTNHHHKVGLYADGVLLYLQDSLLSLTETFNLINVFSKISNYTINWNKYTILPLSEDAWDSAGPNLSLPFHTGYIKYLGIDISPRLSGLFHLNYNTLLKTIEDDLQHWMNLPLSLLGRKAKVKIKILPHINTSSQCYPSY